MLRLSLALASSAFSLTVLDETNVSSTLTETLSLHINSILADESHASLATSDAALTGSLSVILGMGGVKLVGYTCLGHFGMLCDVGGWKGTMEWRDGEEDDDDDGV
eukprot:874363_1